MHVTREQLESIDADVAAQSQAEAALQLRLGQALEVLGRGGCFDLGFSSLTAYALERCERSARWTEGARCLARRLEALPVLRHAVAFGAVSWSKAVLVARVATPSDEAGWADIAGRLTVRQLSARLNQQAQHEHDTGGIRAAGSDDTCTLVCTVDREEAWLFEATRALLNQLGPSSTDEQVEALLAEAQVNLLDALPRGTLELEAQRAEDTAQAHWREQLARWRTEAEIRCESRILEHAEKEVGRASATQHSAAPRDADGCDTLRSTMLAAADGCSALESLTTRELDAVIRNLARVLAERELVLSRLILAFHRADGWRRLGYATETQYARERLGMSRSALLARRALAVKLALSSGAGAPTRPGSAGAGAPTRPGSAGAGAPTRPGSAGAGAPTRAGSSGAGASTRAGLPHVAEALGQSCIGVEAALQLVRIATPKTELAWLARAQQRTIKHLREEVSAALTAVRLSGDPECPPPTEAEMDAFHDLERAASSGRIFETTGHEAGESRAEHCDDSGTLFQGSEGSPSYEGAPAEASAWHVTLASLAEWLGQGIQMCAGHAAARGNVRTPAGHCSADVQTYAGSAAARVPGAVRHAGRVVLRLRVSRETNGWWRSLEKQARRWLPPGMSWLRFCCLSLWRAWRHLLEPNVAYGHIYIRDRHRCTSPVCSRRDVTPHHIQFRAAGGSDDDDNVAAVCTWCHLLGIHCGRIRALGNAHKVRWELGRRGSACLVVEGRERRAA